MLVKRLNLLIYVHVYAQETCLNWSHSGSKNYSVDSLSQVSTAIDELPHCRKDDP